MVFRRSHTYEINASRKIVRKIHEKSTRRSCGGIAQQQAIAIATASPEAIAMAMA